MNAGGLWEDSTVVVDRNLITSCCPDDLPESCQAVINALAADGGVRGCLFTYRLGQLTLPHC